MILVLNCGSQSIKWKLFDDKLKPLKRNKVAVLNSQEYQNILEQELEKLSKEGISVIGHRVVHGVGAFKGPIKITDEVIQRLERKNYLAPLHNPYNILGIRACQKTFFDKPNFAVFDTDFFADLPEVTQIYAIPEDARREFGFRRYGFHGTSHECVAREAAKKIRKPFEKLRIITCHLGGGSSISAIKNGKAIDTSMGFTPMEGLVMMTRAGNVDAGVVLELAREFGLEKTDEILNKESGIKGICGESEMLKVLSKMKKGDKKAKLAFDIFVYSIKKYIGAYFAVLGGCDVLVFTGSVGVGDPATRKAVCKNLNILGKFKVLSIETDEELAIAQKIITLGK